MNFAILFPHVDPPAGPPAWHLYVPKLYTVLHRGYGLDDFRHDLLAGLTVAVVALPLAMALAIASGTTPDKGLQTAIVAGFLISVPLIDASGVTALRQLLTRCARGGTRVILSGLREQPQSILIQMGIKPDGTSLRFAKDFGEALIQARSPP